MDKTKEEIVFTDFPELFPDGRNAPPSESLMCYGFACRNGWYKLIYNLCYDLNKIRKNDNIDIVVEQVKEKFGGLRFYIRKGNSAAFEMIRYYEQKSLETCEICGEDGKLRQLNWYQTLCDKHYEETLTKKRQYIADWNKND